MSLVSVASCCSTKAALSPFTSGRPSTAVLTNPMDVFAFLAAVVALIFWVSGLERFRKLFEVVPPVIYVYFLPILATTAGITPSSSPAYDWTTRYFLPDACPIKDWDAAPAP